MCLAVICDNYLSRESVRMVCNRLNQRLNEIGIRSTPFIPLTVHFDDHDIVLCN